MASPPFAWSGILMIHKVNYVAKPARHPCNRAGGCNIIDASGREPQCNIIYDRGGPKDAGRILRVPAPAGEVGKHGEGVLPGHEGIYALARGDLWEADEAVPAGQCAGLHLLPAHGEGAEQPLGQRQAGQPAQFQPLPDRRRLYKGGGPGQAGLFEGAAGLRQPQHGEPGGGGAVPAGDPGAQRRPGLCNRHHPGLRRIADQRVPGAQGGGHIPAGPGDQGSAWQGGQDAGGVLRG